MEIETLTPTRISFLLEMDSKQVKEAEERVFSDFSKEIEVKGFRKGKAPRHLVEKRIHSESFRKEVVNRLLPSAYNAALKSEKIRPISHPQFELVSYKDGESLKVKVILEKRPEIPLKEQDYKGIEVKVQRRELKEEDIEKTLASLQESRAAYVDEEKRLPPLDDAFAQSVGKFQNLEELRNSIRENLQTFLRGQEKEEGTHQVLDTLVGKFDFPIPAALLEQEILFLEREILQALEATHTSLEEHLSKKYPEVFSIEGPSNEEKMKRAVARFQEDLRPTAVKREKIKLILQEIAERENLHITQEEFNQEIRRIASVYRMTPEAVVKSLRDSEVYRNFHAGMLQAKAALLIRENLKIEGEPV